jgi:transcriptional regulator with XRE-family HTH domain/mannose-6-phosphate isomerase-like protein (cupin superfamily)
MVIDVSENPVSRYAPEGGTAPGGFPPQGGESPAYEQPRSSSEVEVGRSLRALRARQGLSIRALAQKSGLAVNTLSLIENDKSSPSVATLQLLAVALEVPITAFFESGTPRSRIAFTKAGQRTGVSFAHGTLEDLGAGLPDRTIGPFLVTMKADANSGAQSIVHTGLEFVFCFEGRMVYTIEERTYLLEPGDSLLFEAHLPHRWQNVEATPARAILVLCPADSKDEPSQRHFLQWPPLPKEAESEVHDKTKRKSHD